MEIRYLRESDDRLAISKVYEESWKYVYKGIVPKEYPDSIQEGAWVSCRNIWEKDMEDYY